MKYEISLKLIKPRVGKGLENRFHKPIFNGFIKKFMNIVHALHHMGLYIHGELNAYFNTGFIEYVRHFLDLIKSYN